MSGVEDVSGFGERLLCEQQLQAAAYVLGALPAGEARRYREHLPRCVVCRGEVAELQPVVDVLLASEPLVTVPKGLRERVMARVRAEADLARRECPIRRSALEPARRRDSRRLALCAAALIVAAAVASGVLTIIIATLH